jgi:hypothetical protein
MPLVGKNNPQVCFIGLSSLGIQVTYFLANRHINQHHNVLPHPKYNLLKNSYLCTIYSNTKKCYDLPSQFINTVISTSLPCKNL